jgi:hypothetical protein
VCPVHSVTMHPERIFVGGEAVYAWDYWSVSRTQFPHHGGHRYNMEAEGSPYGRDVIDWVCPECHEAYMQYWRKRGE